MVSSLKERHLHKSQKAHTYTSVVTPNLPSSKTQLQQTSCRSGVGVWLGEMAPKLAQPTHPPTHLSGLGGVATKQWPHPSLHNTLKCRPNSLRREDEVDTRGNRERLPVVCSVSSSGNTVLSKQHQQLHTSEFGPALDQE